MKAEPTIYRLHQPLLNPAKIKRAPVIISVPHCGTKIPDDIALTLKEKFRSSPPDTDWHVDRLYEFAPELGITLIAANFSRYVIDLNRNPSGQKLYADARRETELVPTFAFSGEDLYLKQTPDAGEIQRRIENYYLPYHEKVKSLLSELKSEFKNVLFFDAHSILSQVKTIQSQKFPDLILGDQDGRTASSELSDLAKKILGATKYEFSYNHPFKGGYLTRTIGQPDQGVHALQLEMCQSIYMNESNFTYEAEKAQSVQLVLRELLMALTSQLQEMNRI